MTGAFSDDIIATFIRRLDADDHGRAFPGETGERQPIHTVYGGAQLFRSDTAPRLGGMALESLERYAPDPETLAAAVGREGDPLFATVYPRIVEKLEREPVEDFRIDFEDGFGTRPDPEEDQVALEAARHVARGMAEGTLPPVIGIRIKQLGREQRARAFRTLDMFFSEVVAQTGGSLPPRVHVMLPKVLSVEQAAVFGEALGVLEERLGLEPGFLKAEVMIEVTRSIIDEEGRVVVARLVRAVGDRCVAAHFGTYDYTASCQITAAYQGMTHPACDFARHMMQVSLAGTGIWISDGATNVLPVPIHLNGGIGDEQAAENTAAIHSAWRRHFDETRHSLVHGFYQGWDVHPAQLVTRYAAVQSFYLESLEAAAKRLHNFVQQAAQATLVGDVFDDAATGQGLLNFFFRAIASGAIGEEEAAQRTGVTLDELRGRSFVKILENRRGA